MVGENPNRNLNNRARINRGVFLNTNVSNLSNAGECVFFFPPRITQMLTMSAAPIAFV